jgi:uncharacterized membrane protein
MRRMAPTDETIPPSTAFVRQPPAGDAQPAHPHPHPTSATGRTEAFSDGVFAIVITLLILEIKVPPVHSMAAGDIAHELPHKLWELHTVFITYVLSFFIVGTFWVAHHNIFKLILRTDRMFMWINLVLLMCVAFIPFPTALVGEYVDQPIAVAIYGATLIACSLSLLWMWIYATTGHRLVAAELAPSLISHVRGQMLLAPPIYLTAIALAYVSIPVSILMFAGLQFYYTLPGHIDRHLKPGAPAPS